MVKDCGCVCESASVNATASASDDDGCCSARRGERGHSRWDPEELGQNWAPGLRPTV